MWLIILFATRISLNIPHNASTENTEYDTTFIKVDMSAYVIIR